MVRHLYPPPPLLFGPPTKTARVRAVGPDELHPGQLPLQILGQQTLPPVPVVEVRSVDTGG